MHPDGAGALGEAGRLEGAHGRGVGRGHRDGDLVAGGGADRVQQGQAGPGVGGDDGPARAPGRAQVVAEGPAVAGDQAAGGPQSGQQAPVAAWSRASTASWSAGRPGRTGGGPGARGRVGPARVR